MPLPGAIGPENSKEINSNKFTVRSGVHIPERVGATSTARTLQEAIAMATRGILHPRALDSLTLSYPQLLKLKQTQFLLWRPRHIGPIPQLVIGTFAPGNPPSLSEQQILDMDQNAAFPDLWKRKAADCNLDEGRVYHYWFRLSDGHPQPGKNAVIDITDPTAEVVDWRLRASQPALPAYSEDDRMPAAVLKFTGGKLIACDPGGEEPNLQSDVPSSALPVNNRLVIYELPTQWSRTGEESSVEIGVGTFRDAMALIEKDEAGANFSDVPALSTGRAHLLELGVNALELLPIADSFTDRSWGYSTSNYFAPDFDLGFPQGNSSPTATSDFGQLISACHAHGIRFFDDVVMAFCRRGSIQYANFLDFFVQFNAGDPEQDGRDGFGGDLFKYNFFTSSFDPITGQQSTIVPARELMKAQIARWMLDFHIDGIRMDSVNNIMNYDFVQQFKDYARNLWRQRWHSANGNVNGAEERFLVVGEELSEPMALLQQNRLDGMWNEHFKRIVRNVILGKNDDQEPSFEWSVRKLIDCRLLGFSDGAQAVNYTCSHDVRGFSQRAAVQLPAEQRRRIQRKTDQAGLRLPADRGGHSHDFGGGGIRRPARSSHHQRKGS